jgi:hypothetical protein
MNNDGQDSENRPETEQKEAWRPSWRLTTTERDLVDAWASTFGVSASHAAKTLITIAERLTREGKVDPVTGEFSGHGPTSEVPRIGPSSVSFDPGILDEMKALIQGHKEALDIARVGRLAELVTGLENFNMLGQKLLAEGMRNVAESASGIERACRDFSAIQSGAEEARQTLGKLTQELGESTQKSAQEVTEKLAQILEIQGQLAKESRAAIEDSRRSFVDVIRGHESVMDSTLHRADQMIEKTHERVKLITEETGRVLAALEERKTALEKTEETSQKTIRLFQTRALATVVIVSVLIHAAGFVYTGFLAPEIKAVNAEAIAAKAIADHSAAMAQKFDEHFAAVRAAQDEKLQEYFKGEADRLAEFQKDYRKEIVTLRTKVTDTEQIARSWYDRAQQLEAENKKRRGMCGVIGGGQSESGQAGILAVLLLPLLVPVLRRFRPRSGRRA